MSTRKKQKLTLIQKTILSIISISFIVVAFLIVINFLNSPEKNVKSAMTNLASNYYKEQIYQKIAEKNDQANLERVFEEMKDTGFATVYLRQLLYFNQDNTEQVELVKKYCDENRTFVKFYPESPYLEDSYRADFTYSCEFE